ncbi:MAG: energy transducer TonB [Gammaproteobacteria bacterium]|nr:energy transducer TonB [Gammaproteobacteria bacterium]
MSTSPTAPLTPTPIRANDRLIFTLFIAAVIHGIIILGVGFTHLDFSSNIPHALQVILVQTESETVPDKADYLAQVSQQGGGDSSEKVRPTSPFSAPEPTQTDGLSAVHLQASAPHISPKNEQPVLTQRHAEEKVSPKQQQSQPQEKPIPKLSNKLIEHSLEIARLTAEIDKEMQMHAKRPRRDYIDASTQGTPSASYMYNWVKKIERIGNLNYPDQARRSQLSGTLILTAVINTDGTLQKTLLVESSGHTVLDQAAIRIVELAAPYGQFSSELKKKVDILYITRSWQFLSNNRLTSH